MTDGQSAGDTDPLFEDVDPCPNCGQECTEITDINGSALCTNLNCAVEMYATGRSVDTDSDCQEGDDGE